MFKHKFALVAILLVTSATASAQDPLPQPAAALPLSSNATAYTPVPLSYAQQTARFAAEQRTLRLEWNKWIGHEPLRPTMNASYMSNGVNRYYIPSRGVITSAGATRTWYW